MKLAVLAVVLAGALSGVALAESAVGAVPGHKLPAGIVTIEEVVPEVVVTASRLQPAVARDQAQTASGINDTLTAKIARAMKYAMQ
jgi:hypothetical protein